ncbi:MAG: SpoIIE family protein phosphatase [Actinomycetota bacterium]|nr:SpoIIE family protein phosphatase [Actinomycetota bacterium]
MQAGREVLVLVAACRILEVDKVTDDSGKALLYPVGGMVAPVNNAGAALKHSDFKTSAREIYDACKDLVGATAGYVALLNDDGDENELLFLDAGGLSCNVNPSLPMPIRGLRAEAYRTGKPVYNNDFANSEWVEFLPEGHGRLDNVLFAPLLVEGKAVGLMGVANKPGGFNADDVRIVSAFAKNAAITLHNSRLLGLLRNSEECFRSVVQTASDAVISINRSGQIIFWNKAAETIFGYSAEEMTGKALSLIMPERFRKFHEEALHRLLSTGEQRIIGQVVEVAGLKKENTEFPIELSLARWETGEGAFFTGIIRDITERKHVEKGLRTSKRLSDALNDISKAINSTLDFDAIMEKVVVESAEAIGAETAAVALRERGGWQVKYLHGFMQELKGIRLSDAQAKGLVSAEKTRNVVVISDAVNDERVNERMVQRYGIRSVLIMPLIVRNETIGVLFFTYHSKQGEFSKSHVDFAIKLAASLSLALKNARLYEAERHIAHALQETLLMLPEKIKGLEYGYLYRSATEAATVGGDFYDIFEIEQGITGIVVGDVSGSGIEAAAFTSVVRNAIRAFSIKLRSPARVLAKTNNFICRTNSPFAFVTIFFGILDTTTGKLLYSSAGHSPAVLKRKSGAVELLDRHNPIVGVFETVRYKSHGHDLGKGDLLIIYTDGITEARHGHDFFGEEGLLEFVEKMGPAKARDVPKRVFAAVMEHTGGRLSDDAAIVAIRVVGKPDEGLMDD